MLCSNTIVGLVICGRWFVIKIKERKLTSVTTADHEESLLLDRNMSGSYSLMKDRAGATLQQ